MPTRSITQLAHEIRKMRHLKPRPSWREICLKLGVLKADGSADTGLAYQIAQSNFKPTKPETLKRIGLLPTTKSYRCWRDLPDHEIKFIFDNREEMK